MIYSISIWALDEARDFIFPEPMFESERVNEEEALLAFKGTTYEDADNLSGYRAFPAYLLCIDKDDAEGYPICQNDRLLTPHVV